MPLSNVLQPLADILNATCTIERLTETGTDAIGNVGKSIDTLVTGVACAVQPDTSWSHFVEDSRLRQIVLYDYHIYIARSANYTPTHKDRIVDVEINGIADDNIYEILSVLDDGGRGQHYKLGCNTIRK